MKLLLNGGGSGEQTEMAIAKLNQIIDHSKPMLYIPLAMNKSCYDSCYEWIVEEMKDLIIPNIAMVTSFDELKNQNLCDYSCIFIGGGNTFGLLYNLKISGNFELIREYFLNGGIIMGGSAGAIIFSKNLSACSLDDENIVGLKDISCYNVLNDYTFLCHYTNRNPEKDKFNTNALLKLSEHEKILAFPEEDTIFIEDDYFTMLGNRPFYVFKNGVRYEFSPEKFENVKYKINTF